MVSRWNELTIGDRRRPRCLSPSTRCTLIGQRPLVAARMEPASPGRQPYTALRHSGARCWQTVGKSAANQLVETLSGFILWRPKDRIAPTDVWTRCCATPSRRWIKRHPEGTVVSRPKCGLRDIAHVVPSRCSARHIFPLRRHVDADARDQQAPSVELIRSLFDLTPAEARVARGLAAGQTVKGIAAASGTSTIPSAHMSKLYRQRPAIVGYPTVVALLNRLWPPGLRERRHICAIGRGLAKSIKDGLVGDGARND